LYYNNLDTYQNLQQFYHYLNVQQEKINHLERAIEQLQNEVNKLKKDKTSNIEKIEYKFDQLKVERLEGTLNIGITPQNGESSIEDFTVKQNELNVPNANQQQQQQIYETIQQRVHDYLSSECYQDIVTIENQHNHQLDHQYRQYIIDDIRRQIDQRIQYYISQLNVNNLNKEQLAEVKEMTTNKVKEDIHKTYVEFIKNLPRKENGSENEFYSSE
jgi:spore germination protein PC